MRMRLATAWVSIACAHAAMGAAHAQQATETVLHSFGYYTHGANPFASLYHSASGAFYGTTYNGGPGNEGVVFQYSSAGYKVVYGFKGGTDGANPYAAVTQDSAGNFYGTTYGGGASNAGVVYKIDPSGEETVLYAFTGGGDGGYPYAGVIVDSSGNLYGTTYGGGLTSCTGGCGVVYEISPSGQETVLYSFTGGTDGGSPYGGVISDTSGNLYGTTYMGGANHSGVIYELSTTGQETVLYAFVAGYGGPMSGVVRDAAGNLYGATSVVAYKLTPGGDYKALGYLLGKPGGDGSMGSVALDGEGNLWGTTEPPKSGQNEQTPYGSVYKIDTAGALTVVYRFPGLGSLVDALPNGGVVVDSAGNVYGTTPNAGLAGVIYQLDSAGQETTLYTFPQAAEGTRPQDGVIMDPAGNIYGTAGGGPANGGVLYKLDQAGKETVLHNFTGGGGALALDSAGNLYGGTWQGNGTIFKLSPAGEYTTLYTFTGGAGGAVAVSLVLDPSGNIYGVGGGGAYDAGVVFKLDASGAYAVLHTFTGGSDGSLPNPGLILDSDGNLYGTTSEGGLGSGVIYKVPPGGQETVLFAFEGGSGGGTPFWGVSRDSTGNLYGSTANGGYPSGNGLVFEFSAAGDYSVLYRFPGGADGSSPWGGVVRDAGGDLYGTTYMGGSGCGFGCGVVFMLAPDGQETVLHAFSGYADGSAPETGVIVGPAGDLYGETIFGGTGAGTLGSPGAGFGGAGLVYRISAP